MSPPCSHPWLRGFSHFASFSGKQTSHESTVSSLLAVPIAALDYRDCGVGRVQSEPVVRLYDILRKEGADHVSQEDLKSMMAGILLSHPGLEFLQETPEFQDRCCAALAPLRVVSSLLLLELFPGLLLGNFDCLKVCAVLNDTTLCSGCATRAGL